MTTLVAGSTERISRTQLAEIVDACRLALHDVQAPHVTLGRVLYHPEAVMLAVEPVGPLRAIRRALRTATSSVTGLSMDDMVSDNWIPHVTVGYSTSRQPTDPIIVALGISITPYRLTVTSISLVVQWGPERAWDWEPVGTLDLS